MAAQAQKRFLIVGGDKGGVGKTTTALTLHNHFASSQALKLFDGDMVNPDFHSRLKNSGCQRLNIDSLDAWGEALEAAAEADVTILNLPARGMELISEYGEALAETAVALDVGISYFHVMAPHKESMLLLAAALDRVAAFGGNVYAIRNNFFAEAAGFDVFNSSKLRSRCAGEMDLPVLAPSVANLAFSAKEGQSLAEIITSMSVLNRSIANHWLRRSDAAWDRLFQTTDEPKAA
jgi:hypothetical protein